jgi:ABC-type Mn2+/Zn2+ transport system ATPase subunit
MTNSTPAILSPLSIELGTENSRPYKSIKRIVWSDIPPFAVLTGLNGSGKTQLLQVLAHRLTYPAPVPFYQAPTDMPLQVTGDQIGPHEIAYLPSAENAFRVGAMNIANISQAKQGFLQNLTPQNAANNIEAQIMRERISGNLSCESIRKIFLQRCWRSFRMILRTCWNMEMCRPD